MVHCGRHGDRRRGREAESRQQIVGQTRGEPRQKIRARRGDEHRIGPARELDVAHGRLGRRIPEVTADGAP